MYQHFKHHHFPQHELIYAGAAFFVLVPFACSCRLAYSPVCSFGIGAVRWLPSLLLLSRKAFLLTFILWHYSTSHRTIIHVTLLKAFVSFLPFKLHKVRVGLCASLCICNAMLVCRQAFDTYLRMISFHEIRTHFVIVSCRTRTTENAQVKRMEILNATESCVRSVMQRYKTRSKRVHRAS